MTDFNKLWGFEESFCKANKKIRNRKFFISLADKNYARQHWDIATIRKVREWEK